MILRSIRLASTRRAGAAAFLLAALAGPGAASASDDRRVGEPLRQDLAAADLRSLSIDFPVGHLEVIGDNVDAVQIDLEVRCDRDSSRCARRAEDVRLDARVRGDRATIDFDDWPDGLSSGPSLHGTIRVPHRLAVEIDMGVGDLEIDGIAGDLEVDLGVGQLRIEADGADLSEVDIEAGIGEASLDLADDLGGRIERSGWIGRGAQWRRGPGKSSLQAEVGVGEIDVRVTYRAGRDGRHDG